MARKYESGSAEEKLDLVTVCFSEELYLLQLQARSVRRYMDPDMLGQIILVINDRRQAATLRAVKRLVLPEYGDLLDRVRIFTASELVGFDPGRFGWGTQQVLKLLAVREAVSPLAMILDCKNHLIRPVGPAQVWSDDGKIRIRRYRIVPKFTDYFRAACAYFGVEQGTGMDSALPPTTPFPVPRKLVTDMLDDMEAREGADFFSIFMRPNRPFTEFYLLYAYLISVSGSMAGLYQVVPRQAVALMSGDKKNEATVKSKVESLEDEDVCFFGVHRLVFAESSSAILSKVSDVWQRHELVAGPAEARRFMAPSKSQVRGWRRFF